MGFQVPVGHKDKGSGWSNRPSGQRSGGVFYTTGADLGGVLRVL